eukprot:TRINITY_DN51703_c0_g1_i1.p1 TRINITY_DN51703_c0_g1~~TRINITY_DN51703_c0_g1_i1.p1  ORF type:complete len:193 (+),score=52.83 TRINITY_DN51703_c0_g1_i1:77-655(+)
MDDAKVAKIHSAVRWGKTAEEILLVVEEAGVTMDEVVAVNDPKNGNQVLHIASQNGHRNLVKFLIDQKADVNGQNGKGQTPLHMSVEYDFYFQSKILLEAGADTAKQNEAGHEAITGIDGGKTGENAWDNPLNILRSAGDDSEMLEEAFTALEKADSATIDKGMLGQVGMQKKKACSQNWNQKRFLELMRRD